MIYPYVIAVTSNGMYWNADSATYRTERYPIIPSVDMTRWRFSWRPGDMEAMETTLNTTGVTLDSITVGEANGAAMTNIVANLSGGSVTNGRFLSEWSNVLLEKGKNYVVTIVWSAPAGASLAGGVGAVWTNTDPTAGPLASGTGWTARNRVTGSPAILYETSGTPKVTAVIGDSNVAGLMLTQPVLTTAYQIAARASGQVVVNLGYSGESMREQVDSAVQLVGVRNLCRDPNTGELPRWDAVIIEAGINDCLIRPANTGLNELAPRMVSRAYSELASEVWVATLPPAGGGLAADNANEVARSGYNDFLRSSAANIPYLRGIIDYDEILRDPDNPRALQSAFRHDTWHYNALGHQTLSTHLVPIIEPSAGGTTPGNGGAVFIDAVSNQRYQLRDAVTGEYVTKL